MSSVTQSEKRKKKRKWNVFLNYLYWDFGVENSTDSEESLKVNYVSIIILVWTNFLQMEAEFERFKLLQSYFSISQSEKSSAISIVLFVSLVKVTEKKHGHTYN